jgi:hypothetical protein
MNPPDQYPTVNPSDDDIEELGNIPSKEGQKESDAEDLEEEKIQNYQKHYLDSKSDHFHSSEENGFPQKRKDEEFDPVRNSNGRSPTKGDSDNSCVKILKSEEDLNQNSSPQMNENGKKKADKAEDKLMNESRYETFKALRKSKVFVDKTKLIMDFHNKFDDATCILSPKGSGKSLVIKMHQEFY